MDVEEIKKALDKPAKYGPDIDLQRYKLEDVLIEEVKEIADPGVVSAAPRVGLASDKLTYVQANEKVLYTAMTRALSKYGVLVLSTREAVERFPRASDLVWRLVDPTTDKYVAAAYLYGGEVGYFIYVPPYTKVPVPIYTCLAITSNNTVQFAHNVVYVDEGSEANVVTGCAIPHGVYSGVHVGVSEFYVARNAKLTFTMVHAWAEGLHVRPRTRVSVDEGGEYVSYYVTYSPVASIQTYPVVNLGKNARAYLASIIASSKSGVYDIGSGSVLEAPGASVENASRVIARDESSVYARAEIEALESDTRGHVECLGLLLSPKATISSIPIITSRKQGAVLSHEAAIGLIAQKEIDYLMSRGFTEEEAKAVLVRGFMNIEAPIPPVIKKQVDTILDVVTKYAVG
ncbi:MAG: SufD family Fe-S cluster assembly protein [Desulfurococcaceae archaeon]